MVRKVDLLADHPRQADQFEELITKNDSLCLEILKASDLLAGVDVENPENLQQIYEILKDNQSSAEWFALMFALFNSAAEEAIAEGDAKRAAWAVAGAERFVRCWYSNNNWNKWFGWAIPQRGW